MPGDDRGTDCVRGPGRGASSGTPIRDRAPVSIFGGYHRGESWLGLPPQVSVAQSLRRHHILWAPVLSHELADHGRQYCHAKNQSATKSSGASTMFVVAVRRWPESADLASVRTLPAVSSLEAFRTPASVHPRAPESGRHPKTLNENRRSSNERNRRGLSREPHSPRVFGATQSTIFLDPCSSRYDAPEGRSR